MKKVILIILLLTNFNLVAQEQLPYYKIPKMEENYTAQTTVARIIDGLGFRYFWASEGLTVEDLKYQPSGKGRTSLETIQHIYDLSVTMLRLTKTYFNQAKDKNEMSFSEMRRQTLLNIEAFRNKILFTKDLKELSVKKEDEVSIPFFYMINGPIADAIWHTGQISSFRRSSGNPINPKVNFFSGTVRE